MPYYFGHFQLHRWFWLWIESGVVSSDYEWITKIVIPSFRIGVETQKLLEVQLKIHLSLKWSQQALSIVFTIDPMDQTI